MSNIEEDIEFIKEMIKEYKTFGDLHNPDYEDTDKIYKALENLLKRIQELEEEKKTMCEEYCPKIAKIKDLIKNETINISGFECIAVEDIEELLEDK